MLCFLSISAIVSVLFGWRINSFWEEETALDTGSAVGPRLGPDMIPDENSNDWVGIA